MISGYLGLAMEEIKGHVANINAIGDPFADRYDELSDICSNAVVAIVFGADRKQLHSNIMKSKIE